MAVYQADTLSERPIYGSSRLGNLKLLPNLATEHWATCSMSLPTTWANVLTVASDRIHMNSLNTWAEVIFRSDYFPFVLEMIGRKESKSAIFNNLINRMAASDKIYHTEILYS